jgi:hypothetical protein
VVRSVVVVLVMVMVALLTVMEAVLRGCKIFHISILYAFFNLSTYKIF